MVWYAKLYTINDEFVTYLEYGTWCPMLNPYGYILLS